MNEVKKNSRQSHLWFTKEIREWKPQTFWQQYVLRIRLYRVESWNSHSDFKYKWILFGWKNGTASWSYIPEILPYKKCGNFKFDEW